MNHTLQRGGLLRIENGSGRLIHICEGAVWLTQENDPADRYLSAGSAFRLENDGLALLSALEPTSLTLGDRPARQASFWARLFAPNARPTTASL